MDLFGVSAPPPASRWPCLPVPGFMPAAKVPPVVVPPPKSGPRRVKVVDGFAGGGGASLGIEGALQRLAAMGLLPLGHPLAPTYAVNHDEAALAMHLANHPDTIHLPHNVWKVRMNELIGDDYFGLLWLSPDCRDHSPAKGGPITSRSVRDLAWVLVKWLRELPPWQRPWMIVLENVPAFAQWSPLIPTADGNGYERDLSRLGEVFHRFVKSVCGFSYSAGWHREKSCRHGAKGVKRHAIDAAARGEAFITTCNHGGDGFRGQPLGDPLMTVTRARDAHGLVVPHLMTMRNSAKPTSGADQPTHTVMAGGAHQFNVEAVLHQFKQNGGMEHAEQGRSIGLAPPGETGSNQGEQCIQGPGHAGLSRHGARGSAQVSGSQGGSREAGSAAVLSVPCIVGVGGRMGQSGPRPVTKPWQSATTKPDSALVEATLAAWPASGADPWDKLPQAWRAAAARPPSFDDWIAVTGGHGGTRAEYDRLAENGDLVMAPFVSRGQHGGGNRAADTPVHTIAASDGDTNQLVVPYLVPRYGEREGQAPRSLPVDRPMPTPVPDGNQGSLAVTYLAQHNGGRRGPIGRAANKGGGGDLRQPAPPATAGGRRGGGHAGLITLPLMTAYYSTGGQDAPVDDPMLAVPTKARFGLVEADAAPPPLTEAQLRRARQMADFLRLHGCWDGGDLVTLTIRGVLYVIVDIGMRMLTPRELARAQSFPDWYRLDPIFRGKPLSETEQRHKIGNSVTRYTAQAHIVANYRPPLEWGAEAFLEAAE